MTCRALDVRGKQFKLGGQHIITFPVCLSVEIETTVALNREYEEYDLSDSARIW